MTNRPSVTSEWLNSVARLPTHIRDRSLSALLRTIRALQRASGRHMLVRSAGQMATARIRTRTQTIRTGPAKGFKINVAGSRLGYILGTTEGETQTVMEEKLGAGDVFYDLGANIGFLSLVAAALVGKGGAVYSFEPLPANAAAVQANARRNDLSQIEVIEAAVSDRRGTAMLTLGRSDQDGRLDQEGTEPIRSQTITVTVTTIDAYVEAGARPPTLIKIDVEGVELPALHGMRNTLRKYHPLLLCELHDSAPSIDSHPVAVELRRQGYSIRWLESEISGTVGFWACHLIAVSDQKPASAHR
jgi:FkbM family methyltransferase